MITNPMRTAVALILALVTTTTAQAGGTAWHESKLNTGSVKVRAGQLIRIRMEQPISSSAVSVTNHAAAACDVDFVAVDKTGIDIDRTSVVVPAESSVVIRLEEVFPSLNLGEVSFVEIQAAARPFGVELPDGEGLLPVAFFSQRNPSWSGNKLGSCANLTIGTTGCAITSIAMAGARTVVNFNPATLNAYLTQNGGYAAGCSVIWSAPANIDGAGGFRYIGTGTVSSAANLKAVIDANRFAVVRSYRFSSHWAVIIGYNGAGTKLSDFVYLDPWDTSAVYRKVGDYWVTATSATRIYE